MQQAPNGHFHAQGQKIVRTGIVNFRIALGQADDRQIVGLGLLNSQQGLFASDEDRRDHAWKDDQVTQGQYQRLDEALRVRLKVGNTVKFFGPLR